MSWAVVETPIGPVSVEVGEEGVRAVQLGAGRSGPPAGSVTLLAEVVEQLRAYFAGERTKFTLPLAIPEDRGSEFERAVWSELTRIPYGEMRTYGEVAAAVSASPFANSGASDPAPLSAGRSQWRSGAGLGARDPRLGGTGAARAVGTACNHNPIPVLVPCHRVVGAGGKLVGFGAGLPRKRWLLEHEARVALERAWSYSP